MTRRRHLLVAHVLACYLLFGGWIFMVVFILGYARSNPLTTLTLVKLVAAPITVPLALFASIIYSDSAAGVYWTSYLVTVLLVDLFFRWARKRDTRNLPGHCRGCGYDLRATADRCPECGMAVELGSR